MQIDPFLSTQIMELTTVSFAFVYPPDFWELATKSQWR